MTTQRRRPIRRKLRFMLLSVSMAALVLAGAAGIITSLRIHLEGERALIGQMRGNLLTLADAKADYANSGLELYANYTRSFASYIHGLYLRPELADITPGHSMMISFAGRNITPESVSRDINILANLERVFTPVLDTGEGFILALYAATESGVMLASGIRPKDFGGDNIYFNYFASDWYSSVKEERHTYFTNIYQDHYGRGQVITCASPFYDEGGKFAGVVCMDVLISGIHRELADTDLPYNAEIFLADSSGKIITSSSASASSIYNDRDMDKNIADSILFGKYGVTRSQNGMYYAYAPIQSTGWAVCLKASESEILAPIHSVRNNVLFALAVFAGAFAVILALTVIAGRIFSRKFTAPISALIDDVHKISDWELDHTAKVHDNDEIGDLAQSFNEMASSLKEYMHDFSQATFENYQISAELEVAARIQADMLPKIFPPFPDRTEFDIYASMTPAKEVGGDFYDFFMLDDDHLALVIADVSGKGVPAALFMVIAKTLIKNRALMGG